VQFVENTRLKCHGVGQLGTQRVTGMFLIKLREGAIEHGLADDQFTDEIHDGVNTRSLHAESGFGNGGGRGTRNSGLRCDTIFSSVGHRVGRLRFQTSPNNSCSRFLLWQHARCAHRKRWKGCGSVASAFLLAANWRERLPQSLRRGGKVVFGAQGDDGAASMKNVSNELESRGPHQTCGSMRRAML